MVLGAQIVFIFMNDIVITLSYSASMIRTCCVHRAAYSLVQRRNRLQA
jgi:hypothetical protein